MTKKLRKPLIVLLAVLMTVAMWCTAMAADPTFKPSSATGKPGDDVTITINAENNPGISSFKLKIAYDKNVLTFKSLALGSAYAGGTPVVNDNPDNLVLGMITLAGDITDPTLGTLVFTINPDATVGTSTITLSYHPDDVFDKNEDNVFFKTEVGIVDIVDKYTIRFVDEDGTELQSSEVAYGEMPTYTGENPVKAETAQFKYSFKGWDKEIVSVTGDATYTAVYEAFAKCAIKLSSASGGSGEDVTINISAENNPGISSFKLMISYDKNILTPKSLALGPAYRVGTQIITDQENLTAVDQLCLGMVTISGDISDTNLGQVVFTIKPDAPVGTSIITLSYAPDDVYDKNENNVFFKTEAGTVDILNKYTIRFVNEDGTELQNSEVTFGNMPSYTGETPTKASTAQFTYTFKGWDKEIVSVTGNATYTAVYEATVREYTIKFVNEDGTELQSGKVAYGEMPVFTGETPTKAAVGRLVYIFRGWNKKIDRVTGDETYTATYRLSSDINDDGKVNNKDLTRLAQYLAGKRVEVVDASLDVNGDGKVNNKDLTRLAQYLAGKNVEIF